MYPQGLSAKFIGNKLGLSKQTIYSWLKGDTSADTIHENSLKELVQKYYPDVEKIINETNTIMKKIVMIEDSDWKDLILGLQEKLNLEQFELLKEANLKKDMHISDWISGNRIPILRKKFKFIELARKNNFFYLDLIDFGKQVRRSLKIGSEWVSSEQALNAESNKEALISKENKFYINSLCLFPKCKEDKPIKFIPRGNNFLIFYDEKRSTRPRPLILPKLIEVGETFLIGLGIYLGEGSRNRKPKVTNSEPKIINEAIKFYDLFGIPKEKLKAWIQIHERSQKNFNEVRNFWIKNSFLEKNNIGKIRIKKSSGSALVKPHGVVHLEASFILLQLLIEKLLDLTPKLMHALPVQEVVPFLKGVFAAEGSVQIASSGSLREVRYTSTREDERELVKELLESLGIKVQEYKKGFDLRIHGFKNLLKLVQLDIFKYHPERNQKMKEGFEILRRNLRIL